MSDFNDQEQVDMIKGWWKRYGNFLLTVVVIVALAIAGYHWWQRRQASEVSIASMAYMSLVQSVTQKDSTGIQAKSKALIKDTPKSVYAGLAALIWAADDVRQGKFESAQSHLQWIIKNQKDADLVAIAKVRLARLYLQFKLPKKAIALLTPTSAAFAASDQMILGDAYTMQKNYKKASQAYQAAIKAMPKGAPLTDYITMKLHNLPEGSA